VPFSILSKPAGPKLSFRLEDAAPAHAPFDPHLYKRRNLIERAVNKLKQFRRIATRYDRNPDNFRAFLHLAALSAWIV